MHRHSTHNTLIRLYAAIETIPVIALHRAAEHAKRMRLPAGCLGGYAHYDPTGAPCDDEDTEGAIVIEIDAPKHR